MLQSLIGKCRLPLSGGFDGLTNQLKEIYMENDVNGKPDQVEPNLSQSMPAHVMKCGLHRLTGWDKLHKGGWATAPP